MQPNLHPLALAAICLLPVNTSAQAADPAGVTGPSVAVLLQVCDRAAAQGNRGVDAAMCEWYAAPCACKLRGTGADPWCVPEGEDIDLTVRKVLAELRGSGDPTAPAERSVAEALVRLYPCPAAR
jgi:hypothetical protein